MLQIGSNNWLAAGPAAERQMFAWFWSARR